MPTFIVRALQDKPLPIFGSDHQEADFIYVTDTVMATIKAAESEETEGKIVSIGTGRGTRVIDLAKIIIKLCQSKSKLQFLPMRGGEDPETKVIAQTAMLKKLKFKPEMKLEEGLRKTIAYYRHPQGGDRLTPLDF